MPDGAGSASDVGVVDVVSPVCPVFVEDGVVDPVADVGAVDDSDVESVAFVETVGAVVAVVVVVCVNVVPVAGAWLEFPWAAWTCT